MRTQSLPAEQELVGLAYAVAFPATRNEIIAAAEQQHSGAGTIDFIRLFDSTDWFENGVDFINRCEEISLCLSEESKAPQEQLRSP